jgi:hypothetical protein
MFTFGDVLQHKASGHTPSSVCERTFALRQQSFQDLLEDKPILELPVVFTGTRREVIDYAVANGYAMVNSRKLLSGCYFYNRQKALCMLPT